MSETGEIDDGGPAFPTNGAGTFQFGAKDGMSLRDYFAAASFQCIAKRMDSIERNWVPEMLAKTAYEIADAMLAARKGGAQ